MSAKVSEKIKVALPEKLSGCEPDFGKADDVLLRDLESSCMEDSDEFTDWSEDDDDDNSQNLDDDLESNFSEKRCSGDGEEQPSCLGDRNNKRVDDDEDRKNPAYVPRKGSFFEHDLRRDELDHCASDNGKKNRDRYHNRRGVWSWERSKWEHDRFDEKSQRPKSVHELVTFYGFNIRKDCRSLSGFRRLPSRNRNSSGTAFARKNLKSKRNPTRTFIVLRNEEKLDGEETDENKMAAFFEEDLEEKTRRNRSKHDSFSSSTCDGSLSSHLADLEIERVSRGSYRSSEEPLVCFAPKRGEKVFSSNQYTAPVETAPVETMISNLRLNGAEERGQEGDDDVSEYSTGEFTFGRSVFRGTSNLASMKKKRFCAGSGRIAPVVGSRFKPRSDFYQNFKESNFNNDESFSSDELSSSNSLRHASIETSWRGYSKPDPATARADYCSGFRNTYRSRFRGKFRNCGKLQNYCYDGVFPQDVRLIVMCGEGDSGNDNNSVERDELMLSSSSSKIPKKLERDEKAFLTTNQDLILPPVTCCIRTPRANRSSCDSVVYTVAQSASSSISIASSTPSNDAKQTVADMNLCTSSFNDHSIKQHEKLTNNSSNPAVKEDKSADTLRYDSVSDKSHFAFNDNKKEDKRFPGQRMTGSELKGRGSYPRFPVPPRSRIFHPNSFNNGSPSPFLPTAFILPAGPIFSGPQRHPSMPQISTGMERSNVPQILGLNSHHHHQLLALPVRVTPVPFILASSQSLSMPSAQQVQQHQAPSSRLPPQTTSPPSSSSSSSSSSAVPPMMSSSLATSSSLSSASSSSTTAARMTSSPSVSRPTSFLHPSPYRSSPHPKHWSKFNCHYYNMVKSNVASGFQFPLNVHPTIQVSSYSAFNKSNTQATSSMLATSKAPSGLVASTSIGSALSTPASLSVTSKLSPHAAAFKSSQQSSGSSGNIVVSTGGKSSADNHDGTAKNNAFGKPDVDTLHEVPVSQQPSKYWYKSRKACPIEVRGGTVYFSPELQQFQYRCYPSGSKRGSGGTGGFTAGNVVYFSSNTRQQIVTDSNEKGAVPRKPKKVLPIVDPKVLPVFDPKTAKDDSHVLIPSSDSMQTDVTATADSETSTAASTANPTALSSSSVPPGNQPMSTEVLNKDEEFPTEEVIDKK